MNRKYISIKIEGDFIDSFIYSGTLFLVSANSYISIYSWDGLLSNISDEQLLNFLKDCRKSLNLVEDKYQKIHIKFEEEQLKEHKWGEALPLEAWTTDINVYNNCLYIADENGVYTVKFDYNRKKLAQNTRVKLWDKYAYKVSPNNNSRVAIAAGSNGIITAFPQFNRSIRESEDIKTIKIHSYDCEWIGNNLITNSKGESHVLVFAELPEKTNDMSKDSYTNLINELKRQDPETIKIDNDSQGSIIYSWMAGKKLFSLLKNGEIIEKNINVLQDIKTQKATTLPLLTSSRVLAVRSALFGAVIEIGDNLFSLTESGVDPISDRPVSWRVFPRSKSYLNHLHIVENDHLAIRAYLVGNENDSDNYGISFNEVIEK